MASKGNLVNVPPGKVDQQVWLVSFLEYDLGYFGNQSGRLTPKLRCTLTALVLGKILLMLLFGVIER